MTVPFVLSSALLSAALIYAAVVAHAWLRYGHIPSTDAIGADPLLDRFMPVYDVVERHRIRVRARPEITLLTAYGLNLQDSRIVRGLFQLRAWLLGGLPQREPARVGLISQMTALGWVVLAEVPDKEIVMGAVTQPWQAHPVFRAIAPGEFASFSDPAFVKIAWTLRAERSGAAASVFLTETRALATDASARRHFRWYWARFSIGVRVIRWLMLWPVKSAAERRARQVARALAAVRPGQAP